MSNLHSLNPSSSGASHEAGSSRGNPSPNDQLVSTNPSVAINNASSRLANGRAADQLASLCDDDLTKSHANTYDTVTSVHDIEQDDHVSYYSAGDKQKEPLISTFERKLGKILEVPSKNITRNNSVNDVNEIANSKF
jgi:hypothetical protein